MFKYFIKENTVRRKKCKLLKNGISGAEIKNLLDNLNRLGTVEEKMSEHCYEDTIMNSVWGTNSTETEVNGGFPQWPAGQCTGAPVISFSRWENKKQKMGN